MTVLGIATRQEEQSDLATLRSQLKTDMAALLVPDLASAVLPLGVQLNHIQDAITALVLPAGSLDSIAQQIVTAVVAGIVPKLQQIVTDVVAAVLPPLEAKMSALDDAITQLQTDVANLTTVDQSAVALINGFAAQLAAAVAAAQAAGATATQLQSLTDLHTAITAQDDALAAAVTANTPAPPAGP